MAAASAIPNASSIRLLLVSDDPETTKAIAGSLERWVPPHRFLKVEFRDHLFKVVKKEHPDVILCRERGIAGLGVGEVFEIARNHVPRIPVIVLKDSRRERLPTDPSDRGAFVSLDLTSIERLPSVIEEVLFRQLQTGNTIMGSREEIRHISEVVREHQKLVTIGRLAGAIAHEINNPLESIANLLFLIERESGLPESIRGYVTMAQRELDRVIQISKQTLNFYREAASPVRVPLSDLLEEVLVLYRSPIAQKNLEIVRRLDREVRMRVFPGEIRQVFANLIGNAIGASREGGKIGLRIRYAHSPTNLGVTGARITIADDGTGIPADLRTRIGEAFLTTKGQTGTGLGLWVTKAIISRYGGNLLLRSSTGRHHGTVFSIFLPTSLGPQAVASETE